MSQLKEPSKLLPELASKICLSGEGKGRLSSGLKSVSFRFESLLKDGRWVIGAHVPLHGEEALILDGIGEGKVTVSGSLSHRLRRGKKIFIFLEKIIDHKNLKCKVTRSGQSSVAGLCGGMKTVATPESIRFEKSGHYLEARGTPADNFSQITLGEKKMVKMELSYLSCTK